MLTEIRLTIGKQSCFCLKKRMKMRTRKERLGEILGNVCWFRSIVNSVNSWSGVTLVLAATLYSVMESQLQPTGFHKKIEHHLDKDYFMFWQHFGQFCPPSARKHLPIYLYGRACSTLSVGIPDNCHKGTSQVPRPTFRWKWIGGSAWLFQNQAGTLSTREQAGLLQKTRRNMPNWPFLRHIL